MEEIDFIIETDRLVILEGSENSPMDSVKIDLSTIGVPPKSGECMSTNATDESALDLAYEAGLLPECRRSPRHKLRIRIEAIPLNLAGEPEGEAFFAESLNISATGICLTSSEPVEARHLLVEIPGALSQVERVAVEVVRCSQAGNYYEIAGQFVSFPAMLAHSPLSSEPQG